MWLSYKTLISAFTSRHTLYSNTGRYGLGSRRSNPCTHKNLYLHNNFRDGFEATFPFITLLQ